MTKTRDITPQLPLSLLPSPTSNSNMQLTEHFSLQEMIRSATAIKNGWQNIPDELAIINLTLLCTHVLEPLRRRFGVLRITSGYRSKQLNREVGGVEFSQHRFGQAADIFIPNNEVGKKMFDFVKEKLDYDQLIYEYVRQTGAQWLHVSYNREHNRHQAFMNYEMADTSVRSKRAVNSK